MSEAVSSIDVPGAIVTGGDSGHLLHVDELQHNAHPAIGDAKVTPVAHLVLNYDPEAMLWQDSPSAALMIPSVLKWLAYIVIWGIALAYLRPAPMYITPEPTPVVQERSAAQAPKGKNGKASRKNEPVQAKVEPVEATPVPQLRPMTLREKLESPYTWTLYIGLLVIAYRLYTHIKWYLRLKNCRYKMSSQRLVIESGIFSKSVNAYELHHLQGGEVYRPWNLRLYGRDTLYISGIGLYGIRNAEAVRDLIRNAGQLEATRTDKIRVR